MIANAFLATSVISLAVFFGLMQTCTFLIPYRAVLWSHYSMTMIGWGTVAFVNVFAVCYLVARVLFLKDISIKDKDTTFEYVWVGSLYGTFRVPNKIVFYQSEVGNNDVPYPWAVDDQTNVIFFIGDERKDGLSLLRNSPPQLDLQKVLANQQDFMQLADPKNEDSVRSAKILNKERALYKTPEMYDFFWHVLGGHRRRGKRSKLYEGVMSHIKLENVLNLFERRLNRASRKKR